MNIFLLDNNLVKSAEYHVDKHVVKMPLETAQILASAHAHNKSNPIIKPFSPNHPCCLWGALNKDNYKFLLDLGKSLLSEYTYRYKKIHGVSKYIEWFEKNIPGFIFEKDLSLVNGHVLCMPDIYKSECPVESYRNYYINEKSHIATWKSRKEPYWWKEMQV